MTPAARVQVAITIVDAIADGAAAERALTNWARSARYAGSKDRAAVRDLVYDCLRCWRSSAVRGGGTSGRARLFGLLRLQDQDPDPLFDGSRHGPAPLTPSEAEAGQDPAEPEAWDLPDWLLPDFRDSLGAEAAGVAQVLRHRAEVFLRVNTLKADCETAQRVLAQDAIASEPVAGVPTALRVTEGARAVARSTAFLDGLVELQDAASQAVVADLPLQPGQRVLDYCAGGGGKTLALAARLNGDPVWAHDAAPGRMGDLPARAARAGAQVQVVARVQDRYDLVLCDVPCSGSGAWRRSPDGKWRLTPQSLASLLATQAQILDVAADHVRPGGRLAYVTCSVLQSENRQQVWAFAEQRAQDWTLERERRFLPGPDGDGFYLAVLTRQSA